jgi:hypothetical protein
MPYRRFFLLLLFGMLCHGWEWDFSSGGPLIDWWSENKAANRCGVEIATNPVTGKPALRMHWDEAFTSWMHAYKGNVPGLDDIGRVKFTVKITTTGASAIRQCNLRLQDKDVETFYFNKNVRWKEKGQWTLEYIVDPKNLSFSSSVQHGSKMDKHLDFPLNGLGVNLTFERGSGIGEAFLDYIGFEPMPEDSKEHMVTSQWNGDFLDLENRHWLKGDRGIVTREVNPATGKMAAKLKGTTERNGRPIGMTFGMRGFSPRGVLAPKFPKFESAELKVAITTTTPLNFTEAFVICVDDISMEQKIVTKADLSKPGRHELVFNLPSEYPAIQRKGASDMTRLFTLNGFYLHGTEAKTECEIFVDGMTLSLSQPASTALAMELETGTTMRVVLPERKAQGVGATLTNTLTAPFSGQVKLSLWNHRNELLPWKLTRELKLAAGESFKCNVPVHDMYGVYYVRAQVESLGHETDLERPFAYFVPTRTDRTAKRPVGFNFGSVAHMNPYFGSEWDIQRMAEAMALIGMNVLRTDIVVNGEDDWKNWDFLIKTFQDYGINFDMILNCGPVYYKDDVAQFDRALAHHEKLFKRYKGIVHYWEMLNEPDLDWGRKRPLWAKEYIEWAKLTRKQLDEIDPQAVFMSAGYCNFGHKVMGEFHQETMAGCNDVFDLHCFHGHGHFGSFVNIIDNRLLPMRKALGITIPWYANETALTSAFGTSEATQAEAVYKKLLYSWARGAKGYIWYNMRGKGENMTYGEHGYGMLTFDFYPKPIYAAYNGLIGLYRGREFVNQIELGSKKWGFAFKGTDGLAVGLWTELPGETPVVFETDAKKAFQIDLFGNKQELTVRDGHVNVSLATEPATLLLPGATFAKASDTRIDLVLPEALLPGRTVPLKAVVKNEFKIDCEAWMRLTLPDQVACEAKEFRQKVGAQSEWTWTTNLGLKADYRMNPDKQEWMIVESGFEGQPAQRQVLVLPIAKVISGRFDGEPDFTLDKSHHVYSLFVGDPNNAHNMWKGPSDLSAKVWLRKIGDALVVKAEVIDDKHWQPFKTQDDAWKGDSVQLFIKTPEMEDCASIIFFRGDDGIDNVILHKLPKGYEGNESLLQLKTTREGVTTTYEMTIPFAALGAKASGFDTGFRFNLMVNDNDSGDRKGWIWCAPGIGIGVNYKEHPVVMF